MFLVRPLAGLITARIRRALELDALEAYMAGLAADPTRY